MGSLVAIKTFAQPQFRNAPTTDLTINEPRDKRLWFHAVFDRTGAFVSQNCTASIKITLSKVMFEEFERLYDVSEFQRLRSRMIKILFAV